jgi:hypothetical protein
VHDTAFETADECSHLNARIRFDEPLQTIDVFGTALPELDEMSCGGNPGCTLNKGKMRKTCFRAYGQTVQ